MKNFPIIRQDLNDCAEATDIDFEKRALAALSSLQSMQFRTCIGALRNLRSADLTDKNVLIRTIMCDHPDFGINLSPNVEDLAVDMWVDRAEYVDERTFLLYVTEAEPNVFWNIRENSRKPGRMEGSCQRITLHEGLLWKAPFIPLAYLFVLASTLMAMAVFPDTDLSEHNSERTMMAMDGHLRALIAYLIDHPSDPDKGVEPCVMN